MPVSTCNWKGCTSKFSKRFDMEVHICHVHMKYAEVTRNARKSIKNGVGNGRKKPKIADETARMINGSSVREEKKEEVLEHSATPDDQWPKLHTTGISMPELADRWVKHFFDFGAPDLSVTSSQLVVCWMCRRTIKKIDINPHIDSHELPEQELLEKVQLYTNKEFPSSNEVADALLNIARKYGS